MQAVTYFKALSDPTRLRMMRLLTTVDGGICVGDFSRALKCAPYNVSKQLKILEQSGLLTSAKRGRFVYYSMLDKNDSTLSDIYSLLQNLDAEIYTEDLTRYHNMPHESPPTEQPTTSPTAAISLPSNLL